MRVYQPPIAMDEEYWRNSHFSVVRFTGQIELNGHVYVICDKLGRDIFECSEIAVREGREKAIEPGEPCDLVMRDWLPLYRAIGRERFIGVVKKTNDLDRAYAIAGVKPKKGGRR